jgi:hypothetical protein
MARYLRLCHRYRTRSQTSLIWDHHPPSTFNYYASAHIFINLPIIKLINVLGCYGGWWWCFFLLLLFI